MWLEVWEEISGQMAMVVAGAAIVAVFYALILRIATKMIAGIEVPFGQAYATTLICWFMVAVSQLIVWGIGALMKSSEARNLFVMLLAVPAGLFAQGCVVKWRVYVSYRLGMVISLAVAVIVTVLAVVGAIGYRMVT